MSQDKMIGIIGGMGPYASAYFYKLLLDKSSTNFSAKNNNDFPEVVIDSVPVPDFISDTEQLGPAKHMLRSRVKKLTSYGCTTLAMICNTGHLLYPTLARETTSNFISIIKVVSDEVKKSGLKRVGLLATRTTLETRLYQRAFESSSVNIFVPDDQMIKLHEEIIRSVIAHGVDPAFQPLLLEKTTTFVAQYDLDGIILGCTELPLVFPKTSLVKTIDCLEVLADSVLENYYDKTRVLEK